MRRLSAGLYALLVIADVAVRVTRYGLPPGGDPANWPPVLLQGADGALILLFAALIYLAAPAGSGRRALRGAALLTALGEVLGIGGLLIGRIGPLPVGLLDSDTLLIGFCYLAAPALLAVGFLLARFPFGRPGLLSIVLVAAGLAASLAALLAVGTESGGPAIYISDGTAAVAILAWGLVGAVLLARGAPYPARGRLLGAAGAGLLVGTYGVDAILRLVPNFESADASQLISLAIVMSHGILALAARRIFLVGLVPETVEVVMPRASYQSRRSTRASARRRP